MGSEKLARRFNLPHCHILGDKVLAQTESQINRVLPDHLRR
jgi:hypothetical protein